MASGALTYPEVLALWLEEEDRLVLEISLCNLGQGTSLLWACLCFCRNKGTEGVCEHHPRDNACEVQALCLARSKVEIPSLASVPLCR